MIWPLVTVGNFLTALTYMAIAAIIAASLRRTGQLSLRANPLGVTMALVFLTVALRSGWFGVQMLAPELGINHDAALALRDVWTWSSVPLPFGAAAVGLLYLWLRRRTTGEPSLYPDLALRRSRALEINDNIVQGLIAARELAALGEREEAADVLDATLEQAQRMMDDLLEEAGGGEIRPGGLRRVTAAAGHAVA